MLAQAAHGRLFCCPRTATKRPTRNRLEPDKRRRWTTGLRSSTPRFATASRSRASRRPSRTSCASPSSSTTSASHFIEGGWPGANPKDIEFFARAADELELTTSTFVAFGSTRRPRGKVDDDADPAEPARRRHRSAVCIVAKSSAVPRDRGAADDARRGGGDDRRLGRVPARPRPPGARRHGALLRRLQGEPRVLVPGARGGGAQGRHATSCCATPTAARCRTRSRRSCARSTPTSAAT